MSKSARSICVVTGARADFGLLRGSMLAIQKQPGLKLQVLATGSHLSHAFGYTLSEILASGIAVDRKVHILVDGDDNVATAKAIGVGLISFAEVLSQLQPDIVLVLGDRFEILAAALAAYVLRIPVAHIHGGETTDGAIDEGYRHAMTKMSAWHFVAGEAFRKRVIQMGEDPQTVHCVGAPGLEDIFRSKNISLQDLSEAIRLPLIARQYLIIVWHPETLTPDDGLGALQELLSALGYFAKKYKLLFSKSNADPAGRRIALAIDDFVAAAPESRAAFTSLGHDRFISLLSEAAALLGNSSSGIIEAPALGVPSLNIGIRQSGRLCAPSVMSCQSDRSAIHDALGVLTDDSFRLTIADQELAYAASKNTGATIASILADADLAKVKRKKFYDLP